MHKRYMQRVINFRNYGGILDFCTCIVSFRSPHCGYADRYHETEPVDCDGENSVDDSGFRFSLYRVGSLFLGRAFPETVTENR